MGKSCEQCGVRFTRPSNRSDRQWKDQRFCGIRCANRWRARNTKGCGADFKAGPDHSRKIREARWSSPKGQAAIRKRLEKRERKRRRDEERNLKAMLKQVEALAKRLERRCTCDPCQAERARAHRRERKKTPKGREERRRYRQSPKGREANRRAREVRIERFVANGWCITCGEPSLTKLYCWTCTSKKQDARMGY